MSSPWNLVSYPESVFPLISYLVFRRNGLLINRNELNCIGRIAKFESCVGSTILIFPMDGTAVCGLVPGLSFFMGCLTSWITWQERRWNAVLKTEGTPLAKNLMSIIVMSSSLLYVQGSRVSLCAVFLILTWSYLSLTNCMSFLTNFHDTIKK